MAFSISALLGRFNSSSKCSLHLLVLDPIIPNLWSLDVHGGRLLSMKTKETPAPAFRTGSVFQQIFGHVHDHYVWLHDTLHRASWEKVVMLPSESQFLSHLSIPSTLQLHSTTARFPLSFVSLVLTI